MDDAVGLTPPILTNVPVHNFIDDLSWTKGHHTIQFGTNWRLIHNNRQSNAQNLSEGYANLYWMSPSFISGTGASLDPALQDSANGGPLPDVDHGFGTSYDFAAVQLMGIMSQVYTVSNQDKNANLIPSGALVPRHFRNFEGEMYLAGQVECHAQSCPYLRTAVFAAAASLRNRWKSGFADRQHAPVVHESLDRTCIRGTWTSLI